MRGLRGAVQNPNQTARIAYAERRVKPLARLLRCATALRVTAPQLWAWVSGVSGGVFGGFAALLWFVELDSNGGWQPLYYTALRLVLLGALGTFSAFCLRTLRAHLHMGERNLHRQRVANSIPSFVDSAVNHDQRDLILAQLIDAVATFGNSGLLSGRDDLSAPTKLAVDSVLRNISPTRKS